MSFFLENYIKKPLFNTDCSCDPDKNIKSESNRYVHILDSHIPPMGTIAKLFYVVDGLVPPSARSGRLKTSCGVDAQIGKKLFQFDGEKWVDADNQSEPTAKSEVCRAFRDNRPVDPLIVQKRKVAGQNPNIKKRKTKGENENGSMMPPGTIDPKLLWFQPTQKDDSLLPLPMPEPIYIPLNLEVEDALTIPIPEPENVLSENELDLACEESLK